VTNTLASGGFSSGLAAVAGITASAAQAERDAVANTTHRRLIFAEINNRFMGNPVWDCADTAIRSGTAWGKLPRFFILLISIEPGLQVH
jgi:hypothetical protein